MDPVAKSRLLAEAWKPVIYTVEDLQDLLKVSKEVAESIKISVNGGVGYIGVTHHDLVAYIKDSATIAQVPDQREELPVQGQWLIRQGWRIDFTRKIYRWRDPEENISYTLKDALKIELLRLRDDEENVVDVDFEVEP